MNSIYLDYNATTPLDPGVLEAMLPYLKDSFGNPSSIHTFGNKAKAAMDESREKVAGFLGSKTSEITFTSGGTESNNWAIKSVAGLLSDKGNHLITTTVEHSSCLETFRYLEKKGYEVTYIGVDENGMPDIQQLEDSITDKTILISCMYVNNETGVISPIEKIAEIAKEKGVMLHTDAVQAAGKLDFSIQDIGVDLFSVSSHKIYGPKGVGALYARKGSAIESYIHGGGQERGKRSGTENVAGIYGFGRACELSGEKKEELSTILKLRNKITEGILGQIEGSYLNGDPKNRVCNTVNIGFDGIHGESIVMNLDLEGIAVSTGSACSEGNVEPSHVLLSMGRTMKQAVSSLRISLGRFTGSEDIDILLNKLPEVVSRIKKFDDF